MAPLHRALVSAKDKKRYFYKSIVCRGILEIASCFYTDRISCHRTMILDVLCVQMQALCFIGTLSILWVVASFIFC